MRPEHSSMVVIIHSNTSMKCKNRTTRRETSASEPVIAFAKLLSTLRLGAGARHEALAVFGLSGAVVRSVPTLLPSSQLSNVWLRSMWD